MAASFRLEKMQVVSRASRADRGFCGLQDKGKSAPAAVRALFAKRLLKKVAEAYGRMLLIKGLFQADCHPGNILIREDNELGAVNMGPTPAIS